VRLYGIFVELQKRNKKDAAANEKPAGLS